MIDVARPGGGYGPYVWPAYGLSAAAFVWMVADTLWRARRARRAAERLERNEPT